MLVVIADFLPAAVRGRMKLWFIEPRPNIFISGVKDSVADEVVEFLHKHCPLESGLMIFQRSNRVPGYKIKWLGVPKKNIVQYDGLQLVQEKTGTAPE